MKKPFTILCASILLAAIGCRQIEPLVEQELSDGPEFTAHIEDFDVPSKTSLAKGSSVVWSSGDQVAIFQGTSVADRYQVKNESVGTKNGIFTIIAKGDGSPASTFQTNIALYPYEEGLECTPVIEDSEVDSYSITGVNIPSVQTYAAGSFPEESFLMAAVTDGLSDHILRFRNLCGALKLQLKGTAKVKKIELKGNDGELLSGEATATVCPHGTVPSVTMSESASTTVTLDCGDGVQLNETTATDFLIAIPPTDFEKGFTVTITGADGGVYSIHTDKINQVRRSYLHMMPEVQIEEELKKISILAIGNSFSIDAMEYLYGILEDAGYEEIVLGNLKISSCSLEKHANNFQTNSASYTYYTNTSGTWNNVTSYAPIEALEDEDWDYITMQQNSGNSGLSSSYEPYLSNLIDVVRDYCPSSELVWHMTWAYQGNSTHRDFSNYDNDQMTMYNAIVEAAQNVILNNSEIKKIIPNGTSVQNLRTSYIGDNLTRDGYHLSYDNGRYLAAMTFAKALTGCSLEEITYRPSSYTYSDKEIAAIIEAANNACSNPYKITTSSYPPESDIEDKDYSTASLTEIISWEGYDPDQYIQLDIQYSEHAFYKSSDAQYISTLITKDNSDRTNLSQYIATPIYNRDALPDGTLIVQRSGQQYRPEGWIALDECNTESTRPAEVKGNFTVVTNAWWSDWNYRAFNISKTNKPDLATGDIEDLKEGFGIFVPKTKVHNVNAPYDFAGKTAYFFGDSITYGYTRSGRATNGGYPGVFSEVVGLSHSNYGVSGSLFGTYNDLGRIGDKIKSKSLNCDFMFVAGGINDWQCGVSLDDFRHAVEEVCSYISSNYDGEVMFITPINHSGRVPIKEPVAEVQDYRDIITEIALKYDFSVIQGNLFDFPTEDSSEEYKTLMFCDNLHPTEYGYEFYAECMIEVLL